MRLRRERHHRRPLPAHVRPERRDRVARPLPPRRVRAGIGTDAYSFDYFAELRAAGFVAKLTSGDSGAATADALLQASTATGASALADDLGTIAPGSARRPGGRGPDGASCATRARPDAKPGLERDLGRRLARDGRRARRDARTARSSASTSTGSSRRRRPRSTGCGARQRSPACFPHSRGAQRDHRAIPTGLHRRTGKGRPERLPGRRRATCRAAGRPGRRRLGHPRRVHRRRSVPDQAHRAAAARVDPGGAGACGRGPAARP